MSDAEVQARMIRFLSKCWMQALVEVRKTRSTTWTHATTAVRDEFVRLWISDVLYRFYQSLYQSGDGLDGYMGEDDARAMFGQLCRHRSCMPHEIGRSLETPPHDWDVLSRVVGQTYAELRENMKKTSGSNRTRPSKNGKGASGKGNTDGLGDFGGFRSSAGNHEDNGYPNTCRGGWKRQSQHDNGDTSQEWRANASRGGARIHSQEENDGDAEFLSLQKELSKRLGS